MSRSPRPLSRHLAWIIVIKLIALFVLWWCFVKDARVGVGTQDMSRQLAPHSPVQGAPHGQ